MKSLIEKIKTKKAKVAVVGLGYVGTPVAALFAEAGFDVLGLDIQEEKIKKINQGINPIEGKEPGLTELMEKVVKGKKFRATSNPSELQNADVILVSVETPVDDKTKLPSYVALRSALKNIGRNLKSGSMVIIESTIAPKTMETVVLPIIEQISDLKLNKDFFLVHCPERLMPGKLIEIICNFDRVVGAFGDDAGKTAVAFYSNVVKGDLEVTDPLTAEIVKTAENTYRFVQIAFANEIALLCEKLGADVWKVRELINKRPDRNMHKPGAGVGGHCLPKDYSLLTAAVRDVSETKMISAAREINDGMPVHVAQLLMDALGEAEVPANNGRKIAVLGYAYLENSDDTRNSPSEVLVEVLKSWGFEVAVHDPYVGEYKGDIFKVSKGADAVVIMVAHDEYLKLDWPRLVKQLRHKVIVDGRNVLGKDKISSLGAVYRAVGVGVYD
ncbi:MAG: nucleotide sugar dehydrogenase [Parcubacteria group bacterium]